MDSKKWHFWKSQKHLNALLNKQITSPNPLCAESEYLARKPRNLYFWHTSSGDAGFHPGLGSINEINGSQSVVPELAAAASPGNILETQVLGPILDWLTYQVIYMAIKI